MSLQSSSNATSPADTVGYRRVPGVEERRLSASLPRVLGGPDLTAVSSPGR